MLIGRSSCRLDIKLMYASKAFVFVAAAASESWDRKNLEVCMKTYPCRFHVDRSGSFDVNDGVVVVVGDVVDQVAAVVQQLPDLSTWNRGHLTPT
jgi:hypothetical protein